MTTSTQQLRALQHVDRGVTLVSTASGPTVIVRSTKTLVGANAGERQQIHRIATRDAITNADLCEVISLAEDGGGPRALWAAVNLVWSREPEDLLTAPTVQLFGLLPESSRATPLRPEDISADFAATPERGDWRPLHTIDNSFEVVLPVTPIARRVVGADKVNRGPSVEFPLRGCVALLAVVTDVGTYDDADMAAAIEVQLRA